MYNIKRREKEMSGNKYLLVYQGEELEIYQYVRIISDSDVVYDLRLMEFKHKIEDDDIVYYYTIGDRVSLRELAETRGLTKKDFFGVVSSVTNALSKSAKYGIANECFVIDSSFIYIGEVDTLLTCVPFENKTDVKAEFRRLIDFFADKLTDGKEELKKISAAVKNDFSFMDIIKCFDGADIDIGAEDAGDDEKENDEFVNKIAKIRGSEFVWGNDDEPDEIPQPKEQKPKKNGSLNKTSKGGAAAYLLCSAPADEEEKKKAVIKTTPFLIARKFPGGIGDKTLYIARKYISSRHAEIVREKNDYYISDIGTEGKGSKGGTFVNGTRLEPNVKKLLCDGDVIKFYKLEYTFRIEG